MTENTCFRPTDKDQMAKMGEEGNYHGSSVWSKAIGRVGIFGHCINQNLRATVLAMFELYLTPARFVIHGLHTGQVTAGIFNLWC